MRKFLSLSQSDISVDRRYTVGTPSGFNAKSLLKRLSVAALFLFAFMGNVWAEETLQATLDFTSNTAWQLPVGSGNGLTKENTYSDGTYTITLTATTKYYFNTDGYLMIGKQGSKLQLPAFTWKTTKIVVVGNSGASKDTKQNIYVGETAVSTETTSSKETKTYEINAAYQAPGNVYAFQVTSNHNAQVTKIKIYGETGSTEPAISIEQNGEEITELAFGNVKQDANEDDVRYVYKSFDIKASNLTDGITLSNDGAFRIAATNYPNGLNSLSITPNENGAIDTTITIGVYTGTAGTYTTSNNYITISSNASEADFEAKTLGLSMTITPTYSVSVAVVVKDKDNTDIETPEGISAAISGGVYGDATYQKADEDITLQLAATTIAGYEFTGWTYDDTKVTVTDANAASTTATNSTAEVTITANFKELSCSALAAPALDDSEHTWFSYDNGNLAWTAVANAATYLVNVREHDGDAHITNLRTSNTSTNILNLKANTQYDYTVMAEGDGETYCDENNSVLEGSFTTADYPAATLTLSENGVERVLAGSHKLNDVIALPTEAKVGIADKVLVGWSTVTIEGTTDIKPTENYYEAGAEFPLSATTQTLYAVYATETPGTVTLTKMGSTDALVNGDQIVVVAKGTNFGLYQETVNTSYVKNWELADETPAISELETKKIWDVTSATNGKWKLGDVTNGFLYMDPSGNELYVQTENASEWQISWNSTNSAFTMKAGTRYLSCRTDLTGKNANLYRGGGTSTTTGTAFFNIYKYAAGESTFNAYATSGAKQLAAPAFSVAEGTYTIAQSVEITAAEGTIYYNIDSENDPTDESDAYTAAIAISTRGAHTIKAIAIDGDGNKSKVVSLTITLNLPFASFAELVAANLPTGTAVIVNFEPIEITNLYVNYSGYRHGIYVKQKAANDKDVEIYYNGGSTTQFPEIWGVGGKVSGTISGTWTYYTDGDVWEIVPASGFAWSSLTYEAPSFASFDELLAANVEDGKLVKVSFSNIAITEVYNYTDGYAGYSLNIKDANDHNIEIYSATTEVNTEWKAGGNLSASEIEGIWNTDETESYLAISNWNDVTYAETTTAIDNTAVEGKAVKSLQNGMLIIEKGGKKFNAQGQLIK